MQLLTLLTADHAYIDNATGKLYVLGAFNKISMTRFPGRQEKMALVVRVSSEVTDPTTEQTLVANLMDEDGREILKFEAPFKMSIASDGSRPYFTVIVELGGLLFPQPGRYVLKISVGDDELGSTPIDILEVNQ